MAHAGSCLAAAVFYTITAPAHHRVESLPEAYILDRCRDIAFFASIIFPLAKSRRFQRETP